MAKKPEAKKIENKFLIPIIGAPLLIILGIVMLFFNIATTTILATVSIGIILLAAPYFAISYFEFQRIKRAENAYPNFLRDLTQAVNSGMTIPQAVATVSETNYGELSKYVQRLQGWISWDLPFPQAWKNFTNALSKSSMIQRINGVIIESFLAGGDIGAILESLSENVDTLKKMEDDKRSMMSQHLVVMYVVFFVFLSIVVILQQILLPILYLQRFGTFAGVSLGSSEILTIDYFKNLFFVMTMVQAASLGMIAGQITEEKLIAGFKHVIIMLSIGIFVFLLFIMPSKLTFEVEATPQSVGVGQSFTLSGRVFFDAQPAGGAKIEIVTPSGEPLTLFADSLGQFTTTIASPTQPGSYQLSVLMTFGAEVRTVSKTITVS
ncbi:MAG: type II secretion system F family protein [DPANN group archaeon]|nr:type II secretion system F family protein [DPANN group archaeon]